MTAPRVGITVCSRRTLIAEAIAAAIAHATSASVELTILQEPGSDTPARGVLVVDLDAPGLTDDELTALARRPGWDRRAGVFDRFDAPRAALAFDLGLTALASLYAESEEVAHSILVGRRSTTIAADGVTGEQLERLRSLTGRELEVLRCLATGDRVDVVAHQLGISTHTVQAHKRRVFQKLQVQTLGAAVALAEQAAAV